MHSDQLLSLRAGGTVRMTRRERHSVEFKAKVALETLWFGSRLMARHMQREGHQCYRHRVRPLLQLMRFFPIYEGPKSCKKYPEK